MSTQLSNQLVNKFLSTKKAARHPKVSTAKRIQEICCKNNSIAIALWIKKAESCRYDHCGKK